MRKIVRNLYDKHKERLQNLFRRNLPNINVAQSSLNSNDELHTTYARALKNAHSGDIPVIVPTFNSVTYCKKMVKQLQDRGIGAIILFDNGSTFAPMLKYLADPPKGVQIIASKENLGPFHTILNPLCWAHLPNYFCLTDPDLEFGSEMPSSFLRDLAHMTDVYKVGKAGLALDISDRNSMHQKEFQMANGNYTIWDWEQKFWDKKIGATALGDAIYRAPIDTTLAVYNKAFFKPKKYWEAVRLAGRYTCKHLPWYKNSGLPPEEEAHYRSHATRSYYLTEKAPISDAFL